MEKYQCIITITSRGSGSDVVEAARRQGSRGGTIVTGRGSSVYETKKLFGAFLEPEKELVITVVEASKTQSIMEAIRKAMDIETPGKGIMFVLDVEDVKGITPFSEIE